LSGLEWCSGCHPERSEGPGSTDGEILRCAQGDRPSLQMSAYNTCHRTKSSPGDWHPLIECKSQDSVGECGTGIWVGKQSEKTDFRQATARRMKPRYGWFTNPGSDKGRCLASRIGLWSHICPRSSSVFPSTSLPEYGKDAWRGFMPWHLALLAWRVARQALRVGERSQAPFHLPTGA
jgi:hypothetical protein